MKVPALASYWLTTPVGAVRRTVVTQRDRRAAARAAGKPVAALLERVQRLSEGEGGTTRLTRAFDLALSEDAGVVCDALGQQLEAMLPTLSAAQRRAIVPAVCEWLVRGGERERVLAHARRFRTELEQTVRGVNVLTSLEDPGVAPSSHRLPNGHFNLALLQGQLDRGELSADSLARLLATRPLATLRQPELCLLTHQAEQTRDPVLADAALRAYFTSQGVEAPTRRAQGIAGYRFRDAPRSGETGSPLVSVLVAAFNAQHTVLPAIDSLLAQDHPDLEVLVCDDGSRDDTVALLKSRYAGDRRVRLYTSTANQGPYNIRNALLPEARGQIIAYHDADDLALPSRISSQLKALRAESADACFTNWVRVRPSGVIQVFRDQGVRRLSLVSLMAHRSVVESLGGFRSARFAADQEFYLRLLDPPAIRVARVRAPQVLGLWSSQSLTQASGSESLASGFRALPRRAYAAAVFEQRLLGRERVSDAHVDTVLREHGAYVAPSPIERLT